MMLSERHTENWESLDLCVKKVSRFNGYLILAVIIGYRSFPSSKIMGSFVFSGCMFAE